MGGASAKIIAVASPPLSGLLRCGLVLEYTTLGWNVVGACIALDSESKGLLHFRLSGLQLAGTNRARSFPTGERTPSILPGVPIDKLCNTALPAGAGRQDPTDQVQVKD
jgi:hypothetical protein